MKCTSYTLASNLGYLAPHPPTPQDNCSCLQTIHWDYLIAKRSCPKKLAWAMFKCMVSMATPYLILESEW